ncbi:hypothetical protein [Nocardioides sp. SYSU DS0663]|uniref:hypothetical protein n=1 Tax=Nocardioides sp. SYSU DS0663 TaxID=3416445 RepID=UPI003F4C222C
MFVRRSPVIVLGLVLSAAALVPAPAVASDGGTTKGGTSSSDLTPVRNADPAPKRIDDPVMEFSSCEGSSKVKVRATLMSNGEIETVGVVFSDDDDLWDWKFKHNGDFSFMGDVKAKDKDRSFRIVRSMADLAGPDDVLFRAQNTRTGEVCKVETTV